jgi:hypothetical protein
LRSPLDLFEWLHENYRQTPRAKLLEFLSSAADFADLSTLPDDELLLMYCDRMVGGTIARTGHFGSGTAEAERR